MGALSAVSLHQGLFQTLSREERSVSWSVAGVGTHSGFAFPWGGCAMGPLGPAGDSPSPGSPSLRGGSCPVCASVHLNGATPSVESRTSRCTAKGACLALSHLRTCLSLFSLQLQVARSLKQRWVNRGASGGRGGESAGRSRGRSSDFAARGWALARLPRPAEPGGVSPASSRDARSPSRAGAAAPGGAPSLPAGKGVSGAWGGAGGPERPLSFPPLP